MNTITKTTAQFPGLKQLRHNSNAWIGHLDSEPAERLAGQIFQCPANGQLGQIDVYSSSVQQRGNLFITLHTFDLGTHTWGPVIASGKMPVGPEQNNSWVSFEMPRVALHKDAVYGFRIQSSDALVAIGETALGHDHQARPAKEWNSHLNHPDGEYFRYFSLAYKIELTT